MKRQIGSNSEGQWKDSEGTSFDSSLLNSSSGIESLAGKIESLQMVNFMCHSNMELKFNSRVNFITGRNGSGKSAIMAALIVVLGGSASLTNRGSGITDFIKKGATWARVTIAIKNEGLNAFKKDVYGSRIIICRNLSSSGSHGYVVRTANGTVVSKKKEEVDNVIVALNLQIKNPICVLNQDVARTFLCATDSSLRFNMFTKATQLDQLKDIYVKTLELLVASKKHLTTKQKGIQEASAEMSQLKKKLELFASLEKRAEEKEILEMEYFWALVAESEAKVKRLTEEREKWSDKREEWLRGEAEVEREIEELEGRRREWQKGAEEAKRERERVAVERLAAQREVQNLERQIEKEEPHVKVLAGKLDKVQADIDAVKEHLQQNDNIVSQNEAEKREANEKILSLQQRLSEIRSEVKRAQEESTRAEEERYQQAKTLEGLKADVGEAEQNKRRLEVMLTGVRTKGQNNYVKFGQHTQELLQAIEEATNKNYFRKKPIGPCGMHVTLTGNPKWARAVESVIGGLMTTYRCDNQKDFQILSKIMERICGKRYPTIIIGKFLRSRHDVESRKVVVRGFQTVLDVLSFDNDVVFNTFIDQAGIETILLIETDEQAASILTYTQNVPKNLRMGITLQSDQYFPAPNYRTYYGNSGRPLKYFDSVSKSADALKRLEAELKDAGRLLMEKSAEMERAREAVREKHACIEKWKSLIKRLKQEECRVHVVLNQLKDIEDTQPVRITKVTLEEELEGLEKRRREMEEAVAKGRLEVEALREREKAAAERLREMNAKETEAGERVRECEKRVEESRGRWKEAVRRRKGREEAAEEAERRQKEAEDALGMERDVLEERRKRAEEVCPGRLRTEKSPTEIQKLIEKSEKYLKAAEKVGGSREATAAEYQTKTELFQEMKRTAGLLEKAIETLTRTAFQKEHRLNALQSHTSSLVSFYFQAMLRTRGYDGQLKVDFGNRLLDLEVKPKDATTAMKDSKTLSGGERSYSTVSFILAIWKVVHMPFYFLDEFDVFMDKINRKVIMDLLLEHANAQSSKQFVFITPQDISGVQPSDVISVYRLADPERKPVK